MSASVLGQARTYTGHDVAIGAGMPLQRSRRYWRALGYASVENDAVEFTESDLAALRLLIGYVEQGIITERAALQLTPPARPDGRPTG